MIRYQEIEFLMSAVRTAECASTMGLSNMGKSTLMRELCSPATRQAFLHEHNDDWLFVYVDCNLMPERSEQALHEVILRNCLESLRPRRRDRRRFGAAGQVVRAGGAAAHAHPQPAGI